jgi:predicted kinase
MAEVASGKDAARADAQTLFRLAIRYLQPPRPRLVAVSGLSGSGKSTLAMALAPHLGPAPGAVVIRSDVLRKQMMGVEETVPLPEGAYTPEVNARVYGAMNDLAARILAMGHAVVVDAVFAKSEERKRLESVAAEKGVAFDGLWLEAAPDIMGKRIAGRSGDASDATVDVLRRQLAFVNRPKDWTRIDAGGAPEEVAAAARRCLGS